MGNIYTTDGERIALKSDLDTGLLHFYDSCICVGDSVTAGYINDAPRFSMVTVAKLSYPAQLAKMTGWTVENTGVPAYSTSQWWTNKAGNYDYTKYDLAIIELGYNGLLTDTLDADVTPFDSYEDYAQTNTGCYCKIIGKMKADNPNIFIVLVISSNGAVFDETTASVVQKIGEQYDLPVIDLRDASDGIDLNLQMYHGGMTENTVDYTHFNAMGYLVKARKIYHALGRIFAGRGKEINDTVTG